MAQNNPQLTIKIDMEADMLIDNVRTTTIDNAITMHEDRRGDWSEIAIYVSRTNSLWGDKTCAAVITHPCRGARWFCIYDGLQQTEFRTRKEALAFSLSVARSLPEYTKAMEERRANQY